MTLPPPSLGAGASRRGERGPIFTAVSFAASLALVVVVTALSYRSIVELKEAAGWIEHTERVIGDLQKLKVSVAQVYAASCGFALDQSPRHDDAVLEHRREVWTTLADVRTLTADNPSQQLRLAALGHQLAERFTSLDRALHPRPRDGVVAAAPDSAVIVADDSAIAQAIDALIEAERTLLTVRQEHEAESSRTPTPPSSARAPWRWCWRWRRWGRRGGARGSASSSRRSAAGSSSARAPSSSSAPSSWGCSTAARPRRRRAR